MTTASKAADFLQNMTEDLPAIQPPGASGKPEMRGRPRTASTRAGLKHVGGYPDAETVEKVAVLRAGLDLDNSGTIELAVAWDGFGSTPLPQATQRGRAPESSFFASSLHWPLRKGWSSCATRLKPKCLIAAA
jgi:hypothetical protein